MHLRWRLVVVTGAGSGLGREIALRFGRVGAGVLVVDRDGPAAEETAALVRGSRVRAWALHADLTAPGGCELVAARMRDLGGADVLVNNAGGWTPGDQYPLAAPDDWGRTLDLNLRVPMLLTQLFLDDLDHRRGRTSEPGAVVNVASSAGVTEGGYGSPEYAAAKAGLVRFTTSLAQEATAARARVTCVVPDWVGLPRARAQRSALDATTRATLPALIPPGRVAQTVLDLAERGTPGQVVELWGDPPPA